MVVAGGSQANSHQSRDVTLITISTSANTKSNIHLLRLNASKSTILNWSNNFVHKNLAHQFQDIRNRRMAAPLLQPSRGRWISRDPAEEEGGMNLNGSVQNIRTSRR